MGFGGLLHHSIIVLFFTAFWEFKMKGEKKNTIIFIYRKEGKNVLV